MSAFVIFIVSLILLTLLFLMKNWEIYHGRKIFLEDIFLKCDQLIHQVLIKIQLWWSQLNFKNLHRALIWIIETSKKILIAVKRRFDHKQSNFFIKRENSFPKNKGSVSFFLKDVSDYKKSLREGNEDKQ